MAPGFSDSPFVRGFNRVAVALIDAPVVGQLIRRGLVVIRYTGRKSGKTFELPVGYRRSGDTVVVAVGMPDKKSWWRNFLGEGGTITFVGLDGRDRTGHAVAARDERGGVSVTAALD
jgi:hypothetical protein